MRKNLCNLLIELGIISLIIFPPIVFGAVQPQYITYIQVIIFCIGIVWLVKAFIKGSMTYIPTPLDLPIFVLFILGILNFFTSVYPHNTEKSLFLFLYYVLLFFLGVRQLKTARRIIGLAFIIILIGSGESLFGLFQYLQGAKTILGVPTPNIGTLNATYMNHNHFAGFLILIIPIALGLFVGASNIEKKFFLFLLMSLMGTALVLTLSRGALLSFFLALGVFFVCLLLKEKGISQKVASLWQYALLIVLLVAFIALYVGGIGISLIGHRSLTETFFPTKDILKYEIRLPLWKTALALVKESPVFGSGLGTFHYVFMRYRPTEIPQDKQAYHVHNDYLELLIEMGFPGLLVILWAILRFLRYMLRGYFRHRESILSPLVLGGLTSCTAMYIHSFFDFNLHLPANALLFSMVMAMSVAAVQLMIRGHTGRSSNSRKTPFLEKYTTAYRFKFSWKFMLGAVCIIGVLALSFRNNLAMIYYRRANLAHYQRQLLQPIVLYKKAIAIDSYDPLFRIRLAATYTDIGNRTPHAEKWYTLAIQEYKNAIGLNPYNPEYYTRLGKVYDTLGMVEETIEAFQHAIRVNPRVSMYYENLGRYYLSINRTESAMKVYKKGIQINPQRMSAILQFCKRYNQSYEEYQHLIPEDAESRKIFASLLAQQKSWRESKVEYRKAIELSGRQQEYYDAMLNACKTQRDYQCMRALWQELGAQDPSNFEFPVKIAESFVKQQMWDQAVKHYRKLLQEHPEHVQSYQRLAQLYQQQGRSDEALQAYEKLLTIQADNVAAYHNIAAIYRQRKDWNAAIKVYKNAIATGLTQAEIYSSLGELYLQSGNEQKALATFEQTIQAGETRIAVYKQLERMYQTQKNSVALDLLWETYILANKQNPEALLQLIQYYHANRKWLKAVTLSKELVANAPTNATYRKYLADLYEQKKMLHESIEQWEKIVRTHSGNIQYKLHLATLYEKVNQWDNAKTQYRGILRIQPNNQHAKQKISSLGG